MNWKPCEYKHKYMNINTNLIMRTFTMMNSYLITGYFILANKTGTVSHPNSMQRYKWYATAMQKSNDSMIFQIMPWLNELI